MVKTYKSIRFLEHHMFVNVPGKKNPVSVAFTGGTKVPRRINGTYTTGDKAVQDALEIHSGYGKNFILAAGQVNKVADKAPTAELGGENPVEVVNFSQAKSFMVKNYEVNPDELPNKEALLAKAAELNINFVWK